MKDFFYLWNQIKKISKLFQFRSWTPRDARQLAEPAVLPNGGINPTSKDFQTLRGTKFSWVGFFKNHKTSNESPKSPLFWRNSKKIGKSLNFCSKSGYFCPKNLNFPLKKFSKKFVFLKMYIFLPKNFFYKLWKIFQKNITNFFIFEKYSCIKMQ